MPTKGKTKKLLGIADAREKRFTCDWKNQEIAEPSEIGVQVIESMPLAELVPFIDWSPFFHTWEIRGRYPAILEDAKYGEEATKLYKDARACLLYTSPSPRDS